MTPDDAVFYGGLALFARRASAVLAGAVLVAALYVAGVAGTEWLYASGLKS